MNRRICSKLHPISVLAGKLSWSRAFLGSVINDQIKLEDFSGDEVFFVWFWSTWEREELESLENLAVGVGVSIGHQHVFCQSPGCAGALTGCVFFMQYSLSTKRSSPDDGNEVSPYSLSPVSNKR